MSNDKPKPPESTWLPEEIEAAFHRHSQAPPGTSAVERDELVHKLQTHQIELEMQNEELRLAQEQLADSRDAYADLYDFAPVGYVTLSGKGLILKSNLTFPELLGRERGRFSETLFSQFIVDDDQDIYYKYRRDLSDGLEKKSCELRMCKESGDSVWVRLDGALVEKLDGALVEKSVCKVIELRLSITDITERKQIEEEKRSIQEELHHAQKMEAVGQLASGVAHEFNNMLAGIRANTELLIHRSSDLHSKQSLTALEHIEEAAARAHGVTNQLLSFARKKTSTVTSFDAVRCVSDCKEMVEKLISPDVKLKIAVAAQPLFVRAEKNAIEQVMLNLVLNACDAVSDDGTISIRARPVTILDHDVPANCPSGQYVELSVSDNGCGMSPETSKRIFEPFFTTKPEGKGTGLGLSVAYSDVANNGGFMSFDSHEGAGSVVSAFLPRMVESVEEETAKFLSPPTEFVDNEETILVCDDEEVMRDSMKALLETIGYSVIAVESGADALAAAEADHREISLLLTDVRMPGMNGIALGRKIKKQYPSVKILYFSGDSVGQAVAGDDVEILQKGGPISEIVRRIRQCLDGDNPSNERTTLDAEQR